MLVIHVSRHGMSHYLLRIETVRCIIRWNCRISMIVIILSSNNRIHRNRRTYSGITTKIRNTFCRNTIFSLLKCISLLDFLFCPRFPFIFLDFDTPFFLLGTKSFQMLFHILRTRKLFATQKTREFLVWMGHSLMSRNVTPIPKFSIAKLAFQFLLLLGSSLFVFPMSSFHVVIEIRLELELGCADLALELVWNQLVLMTRTMVCLTVPFFTGKYSRN